METESLPLIVLGMHRSGTSMFANALREYGVYLGPEEEFVRTEEADNPDGFWENHRAVAINEKILTVMGGTYFKPPTFPRGWTADPRLSPLKAEAREFIALFEGRPLWGWKDPRNILTMTFWQELVPSAKFLFIWRNPVEVALSIGSRAGLFPDWEVLSLQRAMKLWETYNESGLNNLGESKVAFTCYSDWMQRPAEELARVLSEVGVPVDMDKVAKAASVVNPAYKRKNISSKMLSEPFVEESTRLTFDRLAEVTPCSVDQSSDLDILDSYQKLLTTAMGQLARHSSLTEGYWNETQENHAQIAELQGRLEDLLVSSDAVRCLVAETSALRASFEFLSGTADVLKEENRQLRDQVQGILDSKSFKIGNRMLRAIGKGK